MLSKLMVEVSNYAERFFMGQTKDGSYYVQGPSGDKVIDWSVEGYPVYLKNDDGEPVCGAFTQQGSRRCMHRDLTYTGRCKIHSPWNKGNAERYRGKTMAKTLPRSLEADFTRIMQDPDLLSLRSDIGVIEARLGQLYSKLEDIVDDDIWKSVKLATAEIKMMLDSGDWLDRPAELESALRKLISIVRQGGEEKRIWEEIIETTNTKAKLVKQEQQYLVAQAGMVTKEQVAALLTMTVRSLQEEAALMLPPDMAQLLHTRVAHRIAAYVSGVPTRQDITVVNGLPLVEIKPGERIDGVGVRP